MERHSDLQVGGPQRRVFDAARLLHAAGREAGRGRLLRRPVQEGARNARVEEADGRRSLQPDLHDGRPVREVGGGGGEAARRPDERGRLPRQDQLVLRQAAAVTRGLQ